MCWGPGRHISRLLQMLMGRNKEQPKSSVLGGLRMKRLLPENVDMGSGAQSAGSYWTPVCGNWELVLGRRQHVEKDSHPRRRPVGCTHTVWPRSAAPRLAVCTSAFPSMVLRPKFWQFPVFNSACLLRIKPVENSRITFSVKNPESCSSW